jgi:NurA-like 5'-3' nuclease
MLNLDFIEIGTGNINTLIEEANDDTYGISIEPVKHHFNNLPDKKNVIKINCAISKNQERSKDYIYYIKPEDFKQSLPPGLINCNSVGSYHERHLE